MFAMHRYSNYVQQEDAFEKRASGCSLDCWAVVGGCDWGKPRALGQLKPEGRLGREPQKRAPQPEKLMDNILVERVIKASS